MGYDIFIVPAEKFFLDFGIIDHLTLMGIMLEQNEGRVRGKINDISCVSIIPTAEEYFCVLVINAVW